MTVRAAPTWGGWALGLAAAVYLLTLPPTLNPADESFLLYGAKRVLQGQVLYRDFFDFVTPGSFYLYAISYAIGGVSITGARVTAALLNGISVACGYFLTLRVASRGEAVLVGSLVAVICVPVWNLASHHWMATALSLAAATVLLAARWGEAPRGRPLAAGALLAMVVCTHQQRGVWLMLWLSVSAPALAWARAGADGWRRGGRELGWATVGGAGVGALLLGFAGWQSSFAAMRYAIQTWVLSNYSDYHVGRMAWSGYNLAWADGVPFTFLWLFEAIPAFLFLEAINFGVAVRRHGWRTQMVRGTLLLLALSTVIAILYYPDVIHVAFVAPFSFVVLAGMLFRMRTRLAARWPPLMRWLARLAFAAALSIVAVKAGSNVRLAWRLNPILFDTAFGTLAAPAVRADSLRDLRSQLGSTAATPARVFFYQSEAWFYLALPADNPTPFSYLRPVLHTPAQIEQGIAALERDPEARVVVNLYMPLPDDPVLAYLAAHYRAVGGAGPTVGGAPLYRIFERNRQG